MEDRQPPNNNHNKSFQIKSMPDRSADNTLCLDQFLKLTGIAGTGGQAKLMIQAGEVLVNGEVETRRRRKLAAGDVVECDGQTHSPEDFLSSG